VVNYVLKKPSADDRQAIDAAITRSLSASDALLAGDMDTALKLIHAQPPRPKPLRPATLPAAPAAAEAPTPVAGEPT
jgi:peptidyl-tRNA hydrolase, PTH1 family